MLLSLKYKQLQIIKHSLQYYVTRPGASGKDIEDELKLLQKVTGEVEITKEKYKIS